jgi:hypothetical protein
MSPARPQPSDPEGRSCAFLPWQPTCLAALSGQSPEARRARLLARGLTAKARAKP